MADKALIVVGMSRAALSSPAWGPDAKHGALLEAVASEINYFRARQRPVVYTVAGSAGQDGAALLEQLHPDLAADPLETVFAQPSLSALYDTGLPRWLADRGIRSVTLVGVRTHVEVLYTAAGAFMRGLRVVVPAGCVAAEEPDAQAFALQQIRTVLGKR